MLSQDQFIKKSDVSNQQAVIDGYSGCPHTLQVNAYFGIFLIALVVRFLNLYFIDSLPIHANVEDSIIYFTGAKDWIESGFFSVATDTGFIDQTERMPGYFIFLIPLFKL